MPDFPNVLPTCHIQPLSEELLERAMRQAAETSRFGMGVVDSQGRVAWCNSEFVEKFGYTREEALGQVLLSKLLSPTESPDKAGPPAWVKGAGPGDMEEFLGITREGYTRWVEVYSRPILDEQDEPTGYTLVIDRDISPIKLGEALDSARRAALARLGAGAESEAILRALIDEIETVFPEMRVSIMLLDAEGKRFREGVGPRLPQAFIDSLRGVEIGPAVGSCGTAAHLGERVVSRDIFEDPKWTPFRDLALLSGMRSCWSEPIRNVSGRVIGTFAMYYPSARLPGSEELDFIQQAAELASIVIDRKRLEDELQAARRRAEDASVAKSRFLANISHELRTPLNAIIGFSELINAGAFRDDVGQYTEFASEIAASARTLLALISTLLDSANLQQGTYQLDERIVDLGTVIDLCINGVTLQARRRGVRIHLDWPDSMPTLYADPEAAEKVVAKILDNALKFSPDNSDVYIAGHMASDGDLVVTVSDRGDGIPSQDIDRVLEPFEQGGDASAYLARKYGGTGLGLAICHSLMQLHGGDVELRSTPGQGTRARVVFPASRVIASRAVAGRADRA